MRGLIVKPFYMMRHGESAANAAGTTAGSLDTPLTALGLRQAEAARTIVESLIPRPQRIVHSHLSRARDTAHAVNAKLGLPIKEYPATNGGIGERCYGAWRGRPWTEVHLLLDSGEPPPGGESWDVFQKRFIHALASILAESEDIPLIVTHGGAFDALAAHYACRIPDVKNCQIYAFEPNNHPKGFPWNVWPCGQSLEKRQQVRVEHQKQEG